MAVRYPDRPIDLAVLVGADADDFDEDADEIVTTCIVEGHEDLNPSMVVGVSTQIPGRRLFVHCRVCDPSRVAATLERMEIGLDKPPTGASLWRYDDDRAHDEGADDNVDDEDGDDGKKSAEQQRKAEEDRQKTQAQLSALHPLWAAATPFTRGDEAWTYFTNHRGLPDGGAWETALVAGDMLRVAKNVSFGTKDGDRTLTYALVLLARITTATGRTIGYQLSSLDPGTMALIKPRLTIGSLKGGAIRIAAGGPEAKPVLVLAEGLETGLSRLVLGDRCELRVCCGGIETAGQELAVAWAKARLAEPDLPSQAWMWSRVDLLVDMDKAKAGGELARAMNGAGLIEVRQVAASGARNADLNDVVRGGGVEAVRAAVNGAERMGRGFGVLVNVKDSTLAASDIARYGLFDAQDRPLIICGEQNNYQWSDKTMLWEIAPDDYVRNFVSTVLKRSVQLRVKGSKVVRFDLNSIDFAAKTAKAVRSEAMVADFTGSGGKVLEVSVDAITRKPVFTEAGADLPLKDGWLVNAEIIAIARRHGPEIFVTSAIPVTLDELRTQEPRIFLRMLRESFAALEDWTETDVEAQVCRVFEALGLAIDGDRMGLQRIIAAIGSGGTGKSSMVKVLEELLGPARANIQVNALVKGDFVFQPALEAKAIIIPDVRALDHARSGKLDMALSMILAISGGDSIHVDKKFKPAVSARLTSAVWLLANDWPSALTDSFGALGRRLEFLHFARGDRTEEEDDASLCDAIIAHELGGILRMSLEGLNRLYASNGQFTTSPQVKLSKAAKMQRVNPMSEFASYFVSDAKAYLLRTDVFGAYRQQCESDGARPKRFSDFFSELQATLKAKSIHISQKIVRGERRISGVRWSEDVPDDIRRGPLSTGEIDDD